MMRLLKSSSFYICVLLAFLLYDKVQFLRKNGKQPTEDVRVKVLQEQLKQYGTLGRVVEQENKFLTEVRKDNVNFYKKYSDHLKILNQLLFDLCYRYKTLVKQMHYECGIVIEQMALMEKYSGKEIDALELSNICKESFINIEYINTLLSGQNEIKLLWESIKQMREEQLSRLKANCRKLIKLDDNFDKTQKEQKLLCVSRM